MVTYLGSLVQLCCGEGGAPQTSLVFVGIACSVWATLGCPTHGVCVFLVYTAQAPGCSAGELSKVSPVLHALPRSKPLRFRFPGTRQRYRLGWASVLCPSQVLAAQAARCLASELSPLAGGPYHLPGPSSTVSWMRSESTISGVPCVSS